MAFVVLCGLVGGQNGPNKCWTKILAETLAPLLLGIDLIRIYVLHFGSAIS
jgi:hypothetical protein